MSSVAVPPDGMIARRYSEMEEGLSEDGRRYMYDCLLRGMRGDPMPEPRPEQKVGKADSVLIRQRARVCLPAIDEVRAGDVPLADAPVPPAEQTGLPF